MKSVFMKLGAYVFAFALIGAFTLSPQAAQAQFGKKLKKKLEKKAGQILGVGGKETSGESTPSQPSSNDSTQNDSLQQAMPDLSGLFGGSNVKLPDSYDFTSDMLLEVAFYDKNGKGKEDETSTFRYLFPEDADYLGMKVEMLNPDDNTVENTTMIISENQMITLGEREGSKMAIVMPMGGQGAATTGSQDTEISEGEEINFSKTGRTKDILGYSCDEYEGEDSEMTFKFWLATDLDNLGEQMLSTFSNFSTQMRSKDQMKFNKMPLGEGMILEAETYYKESGEKSIMTTKEINLDRKTSISTSGYQVMDMNGFMKKGFGNDD